MRSSFTLVRIAGIDVGIHYTWVLAFALVTWTLAEGYFPTTFPGWGAGTYWLVGAVSAVALFTSVLVHELSHSFIALARGQGVHSITLFIFGGVSNLKGEARRASDEFLVAVVGPLTSFVLAGLFWAIRRAVAPADTPLGATLDYLAFINLLLGGFNLLPGFPLDGGRVLRSIVWGATGSVRRATQVASYVGQAFGLGLVLWGLFGVLSGQILSGLWTAFIGWFLNSAAESSRTEQALQENLAGIKVAQVMDPSPPITSPRTSVYDFVFQHVLREGERAVLVMDEDQLVGIVTVTDAGGLPQEQWPSTQVSRVMTRPPLRTVQSGAALSAALELLVDGRFNQVPVVDRDRVVGLITRAGVLQYLQLRDELHLNRPPARRGSTATSAPGGVDARG